MESRMNVESFSHCVLWTMVQLQSDRSCVLVVVVDNVILCVYTDKQSAENYINNVHCKVVEAIAWQTCSVFGHMVVCRKVCGSCCGWDEIVRMKDIQ